MCAVTAHALVTVTREEMEQKDQWVQQRLLTASNLPPFSFTYDGHSSSNLPPSWVRAETDTVLDTHRTRHVLTWTTEGLQVKCVAVEYNDYPVVKWTIYFKNTGTNNSPILQDVQGLDTKLSRTSGPEFLLHTLKGDWDTADSYEPYQLTLGPGSKHTFGPPESGKSCDGPDGWPYYNLQMPGGGIILAIGWPGQWAGSFTRDAGDGLRVQAGQQLTHLVLEPGEEIRTPLILVLFWRGTSVVRAQNIWRHFYMAHIIPRVNGRPPSPFVAVVGDNTNVVGAYWRAGIKPDVLWRDADTEPYTWYPVAPYPDKTANWVYTGNWVVDTNSYPQGFIGLSTALHGLGMKFLLWFEPERVDNPHSGLELHHFNWLLPGTPSTAGDILNEGNPAAFQWLTNHFERLIRSNGIDWYREDMNGGGPLPAWRNQDTRDRQGITENFYVQGHLAYWDALLAMNPGLRIDCCGSGGRRNDVEAMRRAVPLWRTDFAEQGNQSSLPAANQCFTYALCSWLPFQGTSCHGFWDPYSFRSAFVAEFGMGGLDKANRAAQQQAYAEWKEIAPIMLNGDYYPLTRYSRSKAVWLAWQFDWPKEREGVVQAFRRRDCNPVAKTFRLRGLDPGADYRVAKSDKKGAILMSGRALMEHGLTVRIEDKPGAAVVIYQRQSGTKF